MLPAAIRTAREALGCIDDFWFNGGDGPAAGDKLRNELDAAEQSVANVSGCER